jgi:hypothetical protein
MSALPPEADIRQRIEHVCFVPQADINSDRRVGLLILQDRTSLPRGRDFPQSVKIHFN